MVAILQIKTQRLRKVQVLFMSQQLNGEAGGCLHISHF